MVGCLVTLANVGRLTTTNSFAFMPRAHNEPDWLHLEVNSRAISDPGNTCRKATQARRNSRSNADPSLVASIDEISRLCRRVIHDRCVFSRKFDCVAQGLLLIGP